ncbi:MAG TPA: hypothetical protein VG096_27170 [Bryobacteraceae bacterium]|jgi:uncharacterized protein YggE|nr:hypothetical protein [Bryobacteraceae bacterium]
MHRRGAIPLLLLAPVLLFGQLSDNAVTVTASPTVSPTPDQVVFSLSVQASVDTSLDAVVGALAGIGITAANLTGFSSPPPAIFAGPAQPASGSQPGAQLVWNFQLIAPLSKVNQTVATLTSLQQTLPQNQSGLSLSFSLTGTQVATPPACNPADLISAARAQAQIIANAAGLNAGALLAMSTQSGGPVCSLTARFALGLMFAPADQHTITITASRSTTLQPDQAVLALTVSSTITATQDNVAAALAQAGISGATLTGVNSTPAGVLPVFSSAPSSAVQPLLQWSFTLTVPVAKAGDTVALLLAAEQSLAKSNGGFSLTFFVKGLAVSQALRNSQTCPDPGLVSDANTTAQTLATAAGVSVGPILSLASPQTAASAGAVLAGQFSSVSNFLLGITAANSCTLTVQYQMMP